MSSSRVGREQDKLLLKTSTQSRLRQQCRRRGFRIGYGLLTRNFDISSIYLLILILIAGFGLIKSASGLNLKNNYALRQPTNFNRTSSSESNDPNDLEPKSALELSDLAKLSINVNQSAAGNNKFVPRISEEGNENGHHNATGSASAERPHHNLTAGHHGGCPHNETHGEHEHQNVTAGHHGNHPHNETHGEHNHEHENVSAGHHGNHTHNETHGEHGHENETHNNQTGGVTKDPFCVEDILRKIFGEFDEDDEDEADEDQGVQQHELRRNPFSDEDLMIMDESRADLGSEKLGNGTRGKLARSARDESESRHRNGPKHNSRSKTKRRPSAGVAGTPSITTNKRPSKQPTKAQNLAKYNEYMDAVLGRMNILIKKKRMDPLRVNLYSGPSKGGNKKGNKNKNNNNTRGGNKKKKNSPRMDIEEDDEIEPEDDQEEEISDGNGPSIRNVNLNRESIDRHVRSLLANVSEFSLTSQDEPDSPFDDPEAEIDSVDTFEEARSSGSSSSGSSLPDATNKPNLRQNKTNRTTSSRGNKGKGKKNNSELPVGESVENENKIPAANHKSKVKNSTPNKHKNRNPNAPRPTRGILHGLSTLRRDGNVHVIRDGSKARIVRAKFLLGPVSLEILPKRGKKTGSSKESSSPGTNALLPSPSTSPALTATAPQLKGVLEVRLSPRSPTRIRKLRVFPPGKVQVDGDKTNQGESAGLGGPGSGYRKISPHATARLRQAAIQVVRQVDHKMKIH